MDPQRLPVLEIGGTHVTAAVVDVGGWDVEAGTVRRELDASGSADEIVATMTEAAASVRLVGASLWGVAIPGPFDYARGIAEFHGVGKLEALRRVDLGDLLRRALTGGAGRIAFVNDAEAFAVGEWTAGAASGHDRAIGVTLGTGVGSAFLVDGVAQRSGPGVPPDGRLDLLEIDGRPLEDTISRRAIRSRYSSQTGQWGLDQLDVREIVSLARDGDADATAVVHDAISALGRTLAPRAVEFGATVVVAGGSIALAWDVIEDHLRAGMSDVSPGWADHLLLVRAKRLTEAALVGAARHALRTRD